MKNMNKVRAVLEEMGLSQKEVKVYLALLKLGASPASTIAKNTQMPRTTAKFACDQLTQKNILNGVKKGHTIIYSIQSPQGLEIYMDRQIEDMEQCKKNLGDILDDMRGMLSPHAIKPKVQFLEGIDGVDQAFHQIVNKLKKGDKLLSYVKLNEEALQDPKFGKIRSKFIKARVKKKIPTRVLVHECEEAEVIRKRDKKEFRETRIVKKSLDFPGGETIILNNEAFFIVAEAGSYFVFAIESKNISEMYKALFEQAWKSSK